MMDELPIVTRLNARRYPFPNIAFDIPVNPDGPEAATLIEEMAQRLRDATDFVDDAIKRWPVGSLELENARVVRERIDAALAKATQ